MLIWILLSGLVVMHKVVIGSRVGHLQCPQVPASFGDNFDLSAAFSVLLDQSEGVGDDEKSGDGDYCK